MRGQIGQKIERAKQLGIRLGFMKAIGYEAEFTCAYRHKTGEKGLLEDCRSDFTPYFQLDDYWYADPLIYKYGDLEYVFMEAYERKTDLGRIAIAGISEKGWQTPEVIIKEEFHLSFPIIFPVADKLYMIPETSTAHKIIIYECESFPKVWKKKAELFEGHRIVDIVPVSQKENKITFVGSECEKDSLRTKFWAFSIDFGMELIAEEYSEYNDAQEYDYRSRNAGYMVGEMFVLQESTPGVYGRNLQFASGKQILPENLQLCKKVGPKDIRLSKGKIWHIIGTHTYSCTENYELIDVQYMRFNIKKWLMRYRNSKNEKPTTN